MKRHRHVPTVVSGLGLGVAAWGSVLFGLAPAASAAEVTNPAENPAPITIKIDGQTYTDGLDTLPGYDDHACTPIPNVEYDFASNQILYYNSENDLQSTAKWTEWGRISSYETWVKQKQAAAPAPSAPAPSQTPASPAAPSPAAPSPSSAAATPSPSSSSAAPAPSTGGASAPAGSSKTSSAPSRSATSKSSSARASGDQANDAASDAPKKGGASPAAAGTPTVAAASSGAVSTTPGADTPGSTPGAATAASAQPEGEPTLDAMAIAGPPAPAGIVAVPGATAQPGAPVEERSTRLAGVGILGALSLAGLALLSGNFLRRGPLGQGARKV